MELIQVNPEKAVYQSNAITSGRYDFSACQMDILFMLLALLEKGDEHDKVYSIWVKDIEAITGRKWDYQQLQNATEDMGSRMFLVETEKSLKQLWLFQEIEYQKGKGYFDVTLSQKARPYLFDLKDNYTVMQLKSALSCSSKYAKRLYALCCQWRRSGIKNIPIGELKEMLFLKDPKGKEKEQFTQVAAFRNKVLEIAKRQINEHTDIEFDYEIINGRRPHVKKGLDTVRLFIGKRKTNQISIDFKEPLDLQKNIGNIMAYGIGEAVARDICTRNKYPDFEQVVIDYNQDLRQGKIKIAGNDPVAYLVGILKNKGIYQNKE